MRSWVCCRLHLKLNPLPALPRTGRLIYGKNKVVAKALGDTLETEYKEGLYEIAKVSRVESCTLSNR